MKAKKIHSYVRRVMEQLNDTQIEKMRGKVQVIKVLHDPSCKLLRGRGDCNCSPEIRLVNEEAQ